MFFPGQNLWRTFLIHCEEIGSAFPNWNPAPAIMRLSQNRPAIEFAPGREAVARSSPAGDQCVASSSSHIHTQFRKRDRFDSAGRCHPVVAKQTDGGKSLRGVAPRISCLSFASSRARTRWRDRSEKTSESIWLLTRRTFKLRECIPGTGYRVSDGLLELGVFRFRFFQDGDVGVVVLPERYSFIMARSRHAQLLYREACCRTSPRLL